MEKLALPNKLSARLTKESIHGHDEDDEMSTASGVDHSEACTNLSLEHGNVAAQRGDAAILKRKTEAEVELGEMTKKENKAISGLRALLIACLIISAIVVAALVYTFSSAEEDNSFETQYESDAQKLFESIGTNFDLTMGAADAFMFRIVSQARSTNTVWPYVTIPDLAVQAAKLISQTDSIYVAFYPLIPGEQRAEWENFTKHNDGWVEEALEVQSRNPNYHGPILKDYNKSSVIWRNEGLEPEDNPGPFLPSWMGSPVIPYYYPYNWNGLAYEAFSRGLTFSMETKTVVVTAVANHAKPDDPVAVAQAATTSDWAIPYVGPGQDPSEPFADMYYPVVDSIDDVVINVTGDTNSLGVVAFSFFWRDLIENCLPPKSKGVILVFHNDCGDQKFTYEIDGKTPIFLGFGDLHETEFDDMSVTQKLTSLSNVNGIYTGLPMNDVFCPYTLTIYPSSTMQDQHVTNDPIIYTVAAALIFLFTSILFLAYDFTVTRKQRLIKQRALASGAIVSALFPDQVRNQLYEENETNGREPKREHEFMTATQQKKSPLGRPNAHLYEETTVFFADLAGFTAWSSTRTPIQVFELLETLYGEFDSLAARRNVFKVETIGDCYVAVAGIPEPQELHAIIMVKFARDCIERTSIVMRSLSDKLGEDTKELMVRVGLHSGNTTAGVLRGDKGRFQLFGDTVNTASRMESNGVKGRIQVSQATADALTKQGKGQWLTARKDKVVAKGKGEMTTYFVVIKNHQSTTTSSSYSDDLGDSSRQKLVFSQLSDPKSLPGMLGSGTIVEEHDTAIMVEERGDAEFNHSKSSGFDDVMDV